MDFIDLSDPIALRQFTESSEANPFIADFMNGDCSDIDEDVDDSFSFVHPPTLPIHRGLDDDSNGGDQGQESAVLHLRPSLEIVASVAIESQTPADYHRQLISNEMMTTIVNETNRSTDSLRGKALLSPSSFLRKCIAVTLEEMWAFFGLIICMGLIVIEDMDEYWSHDSFYSLPLFTSIMRMDRFCLILSSLHLANNDDQPPDRCISVHYCQRCCCSC